MWRVYSQDTTRTTHHAGRTLPATSAHLHVSVSKAWTCKQILWKLREKECLVPQNDCLASTSCMPLHGHHPPEVCVTKSTNAGTFVFFKQLTACKFSAVLFFLFCILVSLMLSPSSLLTHSPPPYKSAGTPTPRSTHSIIHPLPSLWKPPEQIKPSSSPKDPTFLGQSPNYRMLILSYLK